MNIHLESLLKNIFFQAETYLQEIGEFAPFASVLKESGDITPIGIYDNSEIINSSKMIQDLKKHISEGNSIKLAAIASNVSIKKDELEKTAIMIETSNDLKNWNKNYYSYKIANNKIIWR